MDFDHISLFTRILSGNASPADKAALDHWVGMSNSNHNEFEAFKKSWDLVGTANSGHDFDVDSSWNRMKILLETVDYNEIDMPKANVRHSVFRISSVAVRIAAVLVVAVGLYFLANQYTTQGTMLSYSSQNAVDDEVVLPDGTTVFMNAYSQLDYPESFDKDFRRLSFKGEAFFDVAHDPAHPMIIETGDLRVKVMGTSFDLKNMDDSQEVVLHLKTGKVLFYSVDPFDGSIVEQIVLNPGQKGIFNKTSGQISKANFHNDNYLAWKSGVLTFERTPLSEVFKVLENTYAIDIEGKDAYCNLLLTAKYSNESIDAIFESLHVIYGIDVDHEADVYNLR